MICYILQLSYFTESILDYIASEQMDRIKIYLLYVLSKINSIDDKNVLDDIATAVDEIITKHSVGHVYKGCFSRRMYKGPFISKDLYICRYLCYRKHT